MTQDTQDFIENLIANNHDLVVRTHIERIWTDTDEYQVIIGLGGQCPWDRNKTLFCRDNVHVEIDVEKGKVKAVEIMAGPEWFGNKPDWLQELWETRYDGNHLQLLFLNLVCRALPELKPLIVNEWHGHPVSTQVTAILADAPGRQATDLTFLMAEVEGEEDKVHVDLVMPPTLSQDGTLEATFKIAQADQERLVQYWWELRLGDTRVLCYDHKTEEQEWRATINLKPEELQKLTASWPVPKVLLPVSELSVKAWPSDYVRDPRYRIETSVS